MSIAEKLTLLADTKESLRVKLNLGVDMPFSEYYKYAFPHPDAFILAIFADGEQGVWYDPSDRSTLFQDASGIVPVTKIGDPVALMLDKSQGLATNSVEMVDADLGVAGDPYTIRASSVKTEGRRYKMQTTEAVGQYGAAIATADGFLPLNVPVEIEIKVHALQIAKLAGGHGFSVRNSLGQNQGTSTTLIRINKIGTYKARHMRTTDIDTLTMVMMGGGATVGDYIEFEVSIKEIKGNHATQSVSTSRPIYKSDGNLHWLEFDGVDDSIAVNFVPDGRVDVHLDYINKKEIPASAVFLSLPDNTTVFTLAANSTQTNAAANSGGGQIIIDAVSKPNMKREELSQELDKRGHIQMTLSNTSLWGGGMQISGYAATESFSLKGSLGQFVIHSHTSLDDTMNTHKILANKAGIPL